MASRNILGANGFETLNIGHDSLSERALILAPQGRDAFVASRILGEAGLVSEICNDLPKLLRELMLGAGLAVITEDSIRSADIKGLAKTSSQPPWSDFPFVILTERGAGVERNPAAEDKWKPLAMSPSWMRTKVPPSCNALLYPRKRTSIDANGTSAKGNSGLYC